MCMSPAEETLAVTTDQGQLYSVSLSLLDMHKVLVTSTALDSNIPSVLTGFSCSARTVCVLISFCGTCSFVFF